MAALRGLPRTFSVSQGMSFGLAASRRRASSRPAITPRTPRTPWRPPAPISAPLESPSWDPKPLRRPEDWQLDEPVWADPARRSGNAEALRLTHPERLKDVTLSTAWLRDACTCPVCVDPHSGQKNFGSAQVHKNPNVKEAIKTESGGLRVTWWNDHLNKDMHVSEYSPDKIKQWIDPSLQQRLNPFGSQGEPELWDAELLAARKPFYSYDTFMAGGDEYLTALDSLRLYGIFLLRGVPKSETAVEDIAAKLGIIQETFYGRTWDVRSKPKAENVAYTSSFLGLHQDLLYMRNVPKLQLLHCLENDTAGGEALFSDGGRATQMLRFISPRLAAAFDENKTTFRYDKGGFEFENARSATSHNPRTIFWSPPFQKPEQIFFKKTNAGAQRYADWQQANRHLRRLIESPEFVFEYRYQPGDCVVFDNTRLLHGRKQFDSGSGARWLKGTYVDIDSYLNTLYQAAKKREPENRSKGPSKATEDFARAWHEAREAKTALMRQKRLYSAKHEAESEATAMAEEADAFIIDDAQEADVAEDRHGESEISPRA